MIKKIHVFASFGNWHKTAGGGGQTSARRLVKLLEEIGYVVQTINRTMSPYKVLGFIVDPFRFLFHLLLKRRECAIVIVIGYASKLIPYYFLFVHIGHLLGYKTFFYVKGGFTESKYLSFPRWLQNCFKKGLEDTTIALYEGEEGANLSTIIQPETKAVWLPNFVENSFAVIPFPVKTKNRFNLLYFGRIHPNKNVILIVDIFDMLCKSFPNIDLTIVGSGETKYEKELNKRIEISSQNEHIYRIPRIAHDKLRDILVNHHIFIFPSIENQEGHSNSLNEAMSFGLVPVVSNNNFLPSIVGNRRLVANDLDAISFVNII